LAHSCFFAGRYDEASAWAETARQENPNFVGIRRIVMACHALSGRVAEAREACAGAMEIDPTQRISKIRDRQSLQKDEDVARLAEAFRIAGMPE
jgi:hypothetical protein